MFRIRCNIKVEVSLGFVISDECEKSKNDQSHTIRSWIKSGMTIKVVILSESEESTKLKSDENSIFVDPSEVSSG